MILILSAVVVHQRISWLLLLSFGKGEVYHVISPAQAKARKIEQCHWKLEHHGMDGDYRHALAAVNSTAHRRLSARIPVPSEAGNLERDSEHDCWLSIKHNKMPKNIPVEIPLYLRKGLLRTYLLCILPKWNSSWPAVQSDEMTLPRRWLSLWSVERHLHMH